ncbi:MAG: hypothetical protein IGR93_00815 [Hydrococcus sp. C42_A2020_068]|nr:hypothetical protein [Hydrococcus sp. C42_A2020_068]
METLLSSIVAIAAIDSINPSAMAVQIYLLSTPKPIARSVTFIVGKFFAAWIAGWLLILGLTQIIAQLFSRLNEVIYFFSSFLALS